MNSPVKLTSVIIAGGKGERFWPLSTSERPKQFITLWNADKKSMLDVTYERLETLSPGDTWILTTSSLKEPLKKAGYGENRIIFEPEGKNTAMAVAFACVMFEKATIGVFPADHVIEGEIKFQKCVEQACELAEKGDIVIFGIEPDRADTGYGYIEIGKKTGDNSHEVSQFREKPDLATAKSYLEKGNYLWNGGMFVFRTDVMLEAFRKHAPHFDESISLLKNYAKTKDGIFLERAYAAAQSQPIDIAIIEKTRNVKCVSCDFFWDDVGSWLALRRLRKPDADGNVVIGNVSVENVKNSILLSEDSLLAMGLSEAVIVQGKHGTLISSVEEIGSLKKAIGRLSENSAGDKQQG
ncbi:mannose-1-phosphate guanylyltransferase [candidate division WOR-3 bacterium]|nr:mannose-1-phosphate guanylyltransferase [candidate division WOR-3 bacterium]